MKKKELRQIMGQSKVQFFLKQLQVNYVEMVNFVTALISSGFCDTQSFLQCADLLGAVS
jgi:hypothetical protein